MAASVQSGKTTKVILTIEQVNVLHFYFTLVITSLHRFVVFAMINKPKIIIYAKVPSILCRDDVVSVLELLLIV